MLALNSVSKWYGEVCALDRLNVVIPDDCYVSLLGASGSGKTTLLRVIAGFEEQDEGTVTLNEVRLEGMPPHRRGIGFVFQNFALFPHLSVFDNIAFGLRYRETGAERDGSVIRQRVADMVRLVGLEGLERRAVTAISGGQRQRVALARTLVAEPRVVLLDEPLGALDANLRERMCDELKTIRERLGVTFLHVTGSESEALLMGDMVAVLADRRVAQIAPADELYARPVSPEVARRLNAYNILSGKLSNGAFRSKANGFPVRGEHLVDGTPIDVAVRFDRFTVRPSGAAGGTEAFVEARFIASEFTGALFLSFFRSNDGQLLQVVTHMSGPEPEMYETGKDYRLAFDPNDAIVYSGEAA